MDFNKLVVDPNNIRFEGDHAIIRKDSPFGIPVIISPEYAKEILEAGKYMNRPLHLQTIDYYAFLMKNGYWVVNGEGVSFSNDGKILNGQHRLHAVIKKNKPEVLMFIFNIEKEAFKTYDQQYTRTAAHLLGMYGVKSANNIAAVINKYLTLTRQSGFSKASLKKLKIPKVDILTEFFDNRELWEQVYERTEKFYYKNRLLYTSELGGYMGYLIKERKHNRNKVYSFFAQLVMIEQPTVHIAIDMLRDRIYNRRLLQPKERAAYIVKAWNAYAINDQNFKKLTYHPEKEGIPQFI